MTTHGTAAHAAGSAPHHAHHHVHGTGRAATAAATRPTDDDDNHSHDAAYDTTHTSNAPLPPVAAAHPSAGDSIRHRYHPTPAIPPVYSNT